MSPELIIRLDKDSNSPELGYEAVQQLLMRRGDFTAVLCFNDVAAIGAVRALHDAGLRVPTDVSVMGFDDILAAEFYTPRLTTIRQPLQQMGSVAASLPAQEDHRWQGAGGYARGTGACGARVHSEGAGRCRQGCARKASLEMAGVASSGRAATVVAYCAFAATGIGVELPGTLLSSLLARWSLNDTQAGLLFFVFFLGSSGGAVLSRGLLSRSIARGCAAIAAGACLLAVASRGAAFAAMALLGLGLGLAMTSISLLQSRRQAEARTAEMARLNLIWALGASIGPALLLRGVASWSVPAVLYTTAAEFAVLAVLALAVLPDLPAPSAVSASASLRVGTIPLLLLAMVPLATGVESSAGGWLAAYAKRDGLMLNQTITTVTCFWAGILLSRMLQSHREMAVRTQDAALRLAPWLMSAGLLLLLIGHGELWMLGGAALLGFGIGPIYPLLVALVLRHGEAGNIVFLAGGIGASSLPLLTGLVSGRAGSLAIGLTVPLAASVAMGLIGLFSRDVRRA